MAAPARVMQLCTGIAARGSRLPLHRCVCTAMCFPSRGDADTAGGGTQPHAWQREPGAGWEGCSCPRGSEHGPFLRDAGQSVLPSTASWDAA